MLTLYMLFALDMLNISLFLPIFNKYVISLGGSHNSIGLIGTCNALISLIWKPVAGSLSDTKGRKKILLWCIALSLIGNILTYLSSSLHILFLARALCAFGSPVQILLRTTVSDIKSDGDGTVLNKIGAILSVCFMSGALLSGFLSEYSYGIDLVFLLISINSATGFVLANFLQGGKPKSENKNQSSNSSVSEKFHTIFRNIKQLEWSKYWELFAMKGLFEFSYGLMQMSMGLMLLNHFNIDGRYTGYIFCIIGIVSIITNLVFVKLNNTYYKNDKGHLRILHGSILLILSYLGLSISPVYSIFLCFITTMVISRTVLDTTLFELLNHKVSDDEKGTIVSFFDGVLSLSELVAPISSSILISIHGERFVIFLCSVPATIAIVIAFLKRHENIKLNIE